jgi:hypothetical protein
MWSELCEYDESSMIVLVITLLNFLQEKMAHMVKILGKQFIFPCLEQEQALSPWTNFHHASWSEISIWAIHRVLPRPMSSDAL